MPSAESNLRNGHDFWPREVTEHTIWWACSACDFEICGSDFDVAVSAAVDWYVTIMDCLEYATYNMTSAIDRELHSRLSLIRDVHDE